MTGQEIEVCNERKGAAANARLGPAPWPGTRALYWAEVDFIAPPKEGTYSWSAKLTASALELPHAPASAHFHFITVPHPEHTVTVKVVEKSTETPVHDVEVRLGVYRGCTNESGLTTMELPEGTYDLLVWKNGYAEFEKTVEVTADLILHAGIELAPEPEQPYWKG